MENYLENYKKYNKILYKFMGYDVNKELDCNQFIPHDTICGFEILRWVMHKINHNPREGFQIRILLSMKDEDSEIFIQEWHDTSKKDGYVNIVHCKELCPYKKGEVDKQVYENAILDVSHRVVYNACVDYVIKTT